MSPARRPLCAAGLFSTTSMTRSAPRCPNRSAWTGRQPGGGAHQPEVGATHPPVMHERVDDPVGRGVDGYGEAEADPGDRGVDPDDTAVAVGQRTAGVARVERGVGLDDVLDQAPGTCGFAPACCGRGRSRRPPSRCPRVRAGCRRRPRVSRRARSRVAVLRGCRHLSVGTDDGQVGQRVTAHDIEVGNCAVGELRVPPLASPTTWALVTRWDSRVRTTADPADSERRDRMRRAATFGVSARHGGGDRGVGVQCVRLCVRVGGHGWDNDSGRAGFRGSPQADGTPPQLPSSH